MQSLDLIKKRIKSIEATKKITNAMKLVATTKIKAQRKRFEAVSSFCHDYYDVIKKLAILCEDLNFIRPREVKANANLYILITSDLGLCGPYNVNICKHLITELKPEDKIVVFGSKGEAYLKMHHLGNQIIQTFHWDLDDNSYYSILPLSYEIFSKYIQCKYNQIKVIYTQFNSSVSYKPQTWTILPVLPEVFDDVKQSYHDQTIIEPDAKKIIWQNLPVYISNSIYGALVESSLCESSSRRFAMEGATKNATELIDELRVQYNQARQEAITSEINEIVAGTIGKK